MRRRRLLRRIVLGLLLLLLVGAGLVAWLGPGIAAGYVRDRVVARLDRSGFEASIGALELRWSGRVTVKDLEVRDREPGGPSFELGEAEIQLADISWFGRSARIDSVHVQGARLDLADLGGARRLFERLGAKAGDGGPAAESRGGFGFHIRRTPLPRLTLSDMEIDAPGATLSGCAGTVADEGLTTDAPKIVLSLACTYALGDRHGSMELSVQARLNQEALDADLALSPRPRIALGEGSVEVGGVHWRSGEPVELRRLSLSHKGLAVDVRSVRMDLRPDLSPRDLVAEAIGGGLSLATATDAVASLALDDVVVRGWGRHAIGRRMQRALGGVLPGAPSGPALEKPAPRDEAGDGVDRPDLEKAPRGRRRSRRDSAIHRVLLRVFKGLETGLERSLRIPARLHAAMPIPHIRIRRARIVGDGSPGGDESLAVLHHIDADFHKEGRMLRGRISFRAPAAGPEDNHITLRVDAGKVPSLFAEVSLQRLQLVPYAPALPDWLEIGPDAVLEGVHVLVAIDGERRTARLEGELRAQDLGLDVPAIAAAPLHFERIGLGLDLDYDAGAGRVVVRKGKVRLGSAPITWALAVKGVPEDPSVAIEAHLEDTGADALFRAIPDALVSTLREARFAGKVGADFLLRFRTRELSKLRIAFLPRGENFRILDLGPKVRLQTLQGAFVHRFRTPNGPVKIVIGDANAHHVPYDRIPPYLVKAVTTTEDATFFEHNGFAAFAIRRSLIQDLVEGRFVRGASTITQQAVKNLFLSHEKTIARKIQEAIITYALEQQVDKERILEIYFNIIEWGTNLYGIGPAAAHYFGKAPEDLDLVDCLFLVSLIPSPRRYEQQFARGRVTPAWRKRLEFYASKMLSRGKITQEEFDRGRPFEPIFRGQEVFDTLPRAPAPPTEPAPGVAPGPPP